MTDPTHTEDGGELDRALRHIDIARVTGPGGLRPISSFAPHLPSVLNGIAQAAPGRFMQSLKGFSAVDRSVLLTSVGSSEVARVLRKSSSASALGRELGTLTSGLAAAGVRSQVSSAAGEVARQSHAQFTAALSKVLETVRITTAGVSDAVAAWREQMDEGIPAFVERHGWPVPLLELPSQAVWRITDLADSPKREVARSMMLSFGPGSRLYRVHCRRLQDSSLMGGRRPQLSQAFAAQRRGHHYAAICAMLPLVEGMVADAMWITAGEAAPERGVVRKGVRKLDALAEDGWGWMQRSLELLLVSSTSGLALFESTANVDRQVIVGSRSLNRHGILHGVSQRYGTAQNSLRLFLLLAAMEEALSLVVGRRSRHRRKRPSDAT